RHRRARRHRRGHRPERRRLLQRTRHRRSRVLSPLCRRPLRPEAARYAARHPPSARRRAAARPLMLALLQAGLGETLREQPLAAIAALFGAGVLTSLTPCIYPMIPIT